ncbi:MAG: lysophospholipase [Candidatus Azobacteroides sp.]|nr:lysophospholipase [Candidatus Azobacteroides sp.]
MKKRKKKILIGIIIGFLLLSIGALIAIPFVVMKSLNTHVNFNETWKAEEFNLNAEHFFVKTEDGLNISAYEVTVDTPKAVIICLSGIQNPSVTVYFGHAQLFKEHNYATIMLDMRAHGESEGNKICLGYKEWLDVKAIVKHIKEKPLYDNAPIIVFGLSMGAATAINAIGEIDDIDGLISLSAFSSWEDVFCDNMSLSTPKIIASIEKPFVSLVTFLKFGADSYSIKPKKEIEKLGDRPALLMHSKDDSQIPYKSFERLLQHAPSHVETFIRNGDIHFITKSFLNPKEDEEYTEKIIQFINQVRVSR